MVTMGMASLRPGAVEGQEGGKDPHGWGGREKPGGLTSVEGLRSPPSGYCHQTPSAPKGTRCSGGERQQADRGAEEGSGSHSELCRAWGTELGRGHFSQPGCEGHITLPTPTAPRGRRARAAPG